MTIVRGNMGIVYTYAGMLNEAAKTLSESLIMNPSILGIRLILTRVESNRGNDELALAELKKIDEYFGD